MPLLIDGKWRGVCSKCGRPIMGPTVVTQGTRKNKRGRIAWWRDGICSDCERKETKSMAYRRLALEEVKEICAKRDECTFDCPFASKDEFGDLKCDLRGAPAKWELSDKAPEYGVKKDTVTERALEIAAECLTNVGVCRLNDPEKCDKPWIEPEDCDMCIRAWLIAKAGTELRKEQEQ